MPGTMQVIKQEIRTLSSKHWPTHELRSGDCTPTLGMDNWSTFGRPTDNRPTGYKTKGR